MSASKREIAVHRSAGATAFNAAWTLLEKPRLTRGEARELLTLVHTSRYHWGKAGTRRNRAIADWQVSRAFAKLGDGPWALEYALASLSLARHGAADELRLSAHEGLARALAIAGRPREARTQLAIARRLMARLALDAEGREIYGGQIADTERLVRAAQRRGRRVPRSRERRPRRTR